MPPQWDYLVCAGEGRPAGQLQWSATAVSRHRDSDMADAECRRLRRSAPERHYEIVPYREGMGPLTGPPDRSR
jgi:hypothetical protein